MPGCRLKPKMPLAALVDCLWYSEGAPGPHRQERLLPQAQAELVINLRDNPIALYEDSGRAVRCGAAAFSGARSNCFTIDCDQQERVLGVHFAFAGAAPFFRLPMSELENNSFDMADLWGREAGWLRERILAALTPHAMLRTLEQCLLERLGLAYEQGAAVTRPPTPFRRFDPLHPAVAYMVRELDNCEGPARVQTVAGRIGLSQRRLAQLFHEQVGVSPKTFHRVRRFQHTLLRMRGMRQVDWADLSVACGYYDQAHLSHDFRLIAGMTPTAYLAAATDHLNHVPLRD